MKKVTLFVLAIGLVFGAFAQRAVKLPDGAVKSATPKVEVKHQRGIVPVTVAKSSKTINLKAAGCTLSEVTVSEDWSQGGFTATYTITPTDNSMFDAFVMITDSIEANYPNGDEDIIQETKDIVASYADLYAMFGIEWDDSYYYQTEGGDQTVNGLAANTNYTVVVVCKEDEDYAVVKQNFSVGSSSLDGTAAMETASASDITKTSATLTFKKNDQTGLYYVLMGTRSLLEENGLDTEDGIKNYIDTVDKSSVTSLGADTVITVGAENLASSSALIPGTEYLVWLLPYNGNLEQGTIASIEFTTLEAEKTGEAAFSEATVTDIETKEAVLNLKINDQTEYYYFFIDEKDTLIAYDQYEQEGALDWLAYLQSYYAQYGYTYPYYTEDLTQAVSEIGTLRANRDYVIWAFPYNGTKTLGAAQRIEFSTLPSEKNGTAKVDVKVYADEVPLDWQVTPNDQTESFVFYVEWVNDLNSYIERGDMGDDMDEVMHYLINYYLQNDYAITYTTEEEVNNHWTSGWLNNENYPFADGDELYAMVIPYNGNEEEGEITTLHFTIGGVALENIKEGVLVNVYPNPANDYLQVISLNGMQKVEVVNTLGQTVFAQNTTANGLNINVKNFDKGTYFVKVTSNGKVSTQKVIVK